MQPVQRTRINRSAALALAATALVASGPAAYAYDHESKVAAAVGAGYQPGQDLRSPDTRDLASGRGTAAAPDVVVVKLPEPVAQSGGIDWADVGIGAGGVIGLTLVSVGGTVLVARTRRLSPAH